MRPGVAVQSRLAVFLADPDLVHSEDLPMTEPVQSCSAGSVDTGRKRAIELLIKLQTIGNAEVYRLASEAQQMLELPVAGEPQTVSIPEGGK
jgi:hypothetical protein